MDTLSLTSAKMALSCGDFLCKMNNQSSHSCGFANVLDASSCLNNTLVIIVDVIFSIVLLYNLFYKFSSRNDGSRPTLFKLSLMLNGFLGLAYVAFGLYTLEEIFRMGKDFAPLHSWLALLTQGVTWILVGLVLNTQNNFKVLLSLVIIFSLFLFACSIFQIVVEHKMSIENFLNIFSLPISLFCLLFSFIQSEKLDDQIKTSEETLYTPLNDEQPKDDFVTPFANAGIFSRLSFWWLNSLMRKGYEKPLEENDLPLLSKKDRAEFQYTQFLDKLNKQKQSNKPASSLIFWTIISCHRNDILISGFFALLKVLMISAGPVILNSFINVASGNEHFEYEGYALAFGLFLAKCLESLSQRQWYFRARRLGLQLRSLLTAAIYKKQLKLSNSAKLVHSSGEIMNYATVDAYRIGEFPYWFHQIWTTSFQLCLALIILYNALGLATISALAVIILTVALNAPLAKLQHKYQTKLMEAQDVRLKAVSEALVYMKVLKLYAWETHFQKVIEGYREEECVWLRAFQLRRTYNICLFWMSPVIVSAATFSSCYFLGIPLNAGNVFTFVATLRLVQDPVRSIPDVIGVVIQAKVAFARIVKFLDASELQNVHVKKKFSAETKDPIVIKSASFAWDEQLIKPTLKNVSLVVKAGEKVAVCGEVGSGKSSLLAAILGEIPRTDGMVHICGKIAYVSQNAWIQTGTIKDNILFGSPMDNQRYQETLENCSLIKDIEMLPFGDQTEIGERGVNLSGGQKQRVQLARALYQNADIYLLDDPFSAVDAHTASSLFNEYVVDALSSKTVLLVTHQVDFLPAFNSILLMSDGEILKAAPYHYLLESCKEFQDLVNAHNETMDSERMNQLVSHEKIKSKTEISVQNYPDLNKKDKVFGVDQLIKKEEKETGDMGLKPYLLYLNQNKGLLYFSVGILFHIVFIAGQISQNSWMAANVQNPEVSMLKLISVYLVIAFSTTFFVFGRSLLVVVLGMQSSRSLFSQLLDSIFHAPMSFFDSTPLGRILSRISSDLSIIDLDIPFTLFFSCCASLNAISNLGVLSVVTWPVLFVAVPLLYITLRIQRYYYAAAKELMRLNGTTRSKFANHLAESISGTMTIRAFEEESQFLAKNYELIDKNASPFFHNFAATEWLIQRLETVSAAMLSSSALAMVLLPPGTFTPGFVGMALSYGLSLNMSIVFSIQNQCIIANNIISVERINQYMHVPSEAPKIIESNRPNPSWPAIGRVELQNLQIRYREDSPLVLRGISCVFEGGHKIGIVGRTGSGKSTLIGALFRLVEPTAGKIIIDNVDITTIGLHDLRSRIGIIPQDPTLFQGSVRYNLDPLCQYTDQQIWEVLDKCQLRDAVLEKEQGLNSLVTEDGGNWSMGQRQLFCLGRALLRRSRILVLDEATASIDNATDAILQKTIRSEFADRTVITVAHRIPTVMDCTMVLSISDGKMVEYDEPMKLMKREGSLFAELVKEYWSHTANPAYIIYPIAHSLVNCESPKGFK